MTISSVNLKKRIWHNSRQEVEFEPDEADPRFTTDTSTLLDEAQGQSAEDVMYAYVEAFKNSDADAMRSLVTTGTAREQFVVRTV